MVSNALTGLLALFLALVSLVAATPLPKPDPMPFGPGSDGAAFVHGLGDLISLAADKNYMRTSPSWGNCMAAREEWTNAKRRLIKREALGGFTRLRGRLRGGRGTGNKRDKDHKADYPGAELKDGLPTHDQNGKKYLCI